MEITVGVIILAAALLLAYTLSKRQLAKRKYIVWGILTMVPIAPVLSWLLAILYSLSFENDHFEAIGLLIIMIPILFLIGLVIFLRGIFTKEKSPY